MQIPREYQALIGEIDLSDMINEYKTLIEKSNSEGPTPSKSPDKFLKLIESTNLLDKAYILAAKKVESLARREIAV